MVFYCVDGEFEFFYFEDIEEFELGMYWIFELKSELCDVWEKWIDVKELDLIMVFGVVFDF